MNLNLSLFLLALPSLILGESNNLRGAEVERELATNGFHENLGSCSGATCGMWGDPHMVTCDGLGYDCQGIGVFTLMQNHMFNVQARFVDVGAHEHNLVRGWGLTHGASLTNDVSIEFLQNPEVPVIQLGFGKVHYDYQETETFASEEGCSPWTTHTPLNMPGQGRTVEPSVQACRQRCEGVEGCTAFAWWADGGCHLNIDTDTPVPSPRHWSRALAGRLDNDCGKPFEEPEVEDPTEESMHGVIGPRNNCPLLMHLDGELVDISDVHSNGGTLYGGEGEPMWVRRWNNDVVVNWKTNTGDYATAKYIARGDGPGELWSCHWNFYICLPASQQDQFEATTVGLLGSPDGNTHNDWMDTEGNELEVLWHHNPNRHEDAIDYCYDNWCVSQIDSIVMPPSGETWEDIKCEHEDYEDFDIDSGCILSAEKIKDACKEVPPLLQHACEVDCCNGGCGEVPETVEEIDENLKELSEDDEDIQYDVPKHDECEDDTFENTGETVCPDAGESIVTLVNTKGSVDLPDGAEVIYGIVPNVEPHDGMSGMSVRFLINNPFDDIADIYVKHDKSVYGSFMDPVCDPLEKVDSGCDTGATPVEVACHEYPGMAPFALVQVYFSSRGIPGSETSVDKCCDAPDDEAAGVVEYTFEIMCQCPGEVVG